MAPGCDNSYYCCNTIDLVLIPLEGNGTVASVFV